MTGSKDMKKPLIVSSESGILVDNFFFQERSLMFNMAWPMMVSFFCRMGMASVDSAFVGHITNGDFSPKEFLAAAGLSDMVTNILIIPPLAFNMSLNALVSQAIGSGNKKMAGVWLQLSVFWLTITYLPCLVSFFFVSDMLRLLGFSENIAMLAGRYARWNVFWPIPNGWYQCMRFYFQAQGNTRPAMYNNMFFLGFNVLLNWTFVFGGPFRWLGWNGFGFIGAAMSLSCSRSLQPLMYWLYMFCYKQHHRDTWPGWNLDFLKADRVRIFMNQALPQVGTLIFQAALGQTTTLLIAQLGNLAIAASAAATALTQIFTGGLSASLNAVCGIRVGFHLGQGNGTSAKRSALMIFSFSFYSVTAIAVCLLPFGHEAVSLITSDQEVVELATQLIPPVLLNTLAGLIVECNTGGIFTSQGRTVLSTVLSMGVELPLNIGSIAFLVLYMKVGLVPVYWAQAAVSFLELILVLSIFVRSDWDRYAKDAKQRQEVEEAEERATGRGRMSPASRFASPASPMAKMYRSPMCAKADVFSELAAPPPITEAEAGEVTMTIEEL